MRRNRRDNTKKERIIMIASSVFVLTALTMTGVYMQSKNQEFENDGYTIDFTVLENNVDNKRQEIAENSLSNKDILGDDNILGGMTDIPGGLEDDLDYISTEAGSNLVEIPGLTDGENGDGETQGNGQPVDKTPIARDNTQQTPVTEQTAEQPVEHSTEQLSGQPSEPLVEKPKNNGGQDAMGENVVATRELHYSENSGLLRPLEGELNVLIPYSQETSVLFKTLKEYKRSDFMVISAAEGTAVKACAEGKVVRIFQDAEYGHAVTMELGDGYQITYGQLRDIAVAVGSYVNAGDVFAAVAAPTKYYVKEGSNLYLQLTANNTAIDPSPLFQ